jgi:hypothetical protein
MPFKTNKVKITFSGSDNKSAKRDIYPGFGTKGIFVTNKGKISIVGPKVDKTWSTLAFAEDKGKY